MFIKCKILDKWIYIYIYSFCIYKNIYNNKKQIYTYTILTRYSIPSGATRGAYPVSPPPPQHISPSSFDYTTRYIQVHFMYRAEFKPAGHWASSTVQIRRNTKEYGIERIQMTQPALPYYYTCFADGTPFK